MPTNEARAWVRDATPLADVVRSQSDENLRVYETSPTRVDEDANQEMNLAHGGYGKRQLLELVQNGADAMLDSVGGRIHVVLTNDNLYCANEGEPINADGIRTLLHSHISQKRGDEIGRFGLGFKSLLGVSTRPQFFCRDVSLGFDADWARDTISRVAPGRRRYPALRLARLLDPNVAAAEDPVLANLMSFATTIVRVPRDAGRSEWLSKDLEDFDPAFMLFSPHVGRLTLEEPATGLRRDIQLQRDSNDLVLIEGSQVRRWRVFRSLIKPSDEARREAWQLSDRPTLPVVWAVPVEGRLAVGRFWAFFPLRDETTLTGIANAPWQINDDRTGLLANSRLNTELLDELARLAIQSLSKLIRRDDPGWIMEVMPARGREARCWGDEYVTDAFYRRAVSVPVIPNQDGSLRRASDLRFPPQNTPRAALEAWSAAPSRPSNWCHATSVATTTRRSRVERLFQAAGANEEGESVQSWLESLFDDDISIENAAQAIIAAAKYLDAEERTTGLTFTHIRAVRRAKIILNSRHELVPAEPTKIFLPSSNLESVSRADIVHPKLVGRPDVLAALSALEIRPLTAEEALRDYLRHLRPTDSATAWDKVWILVRHVEGEGRAASIVAEELRNRAVLVRTADGSYRPIGAALLPGRVIPADTARDRTLLIDTEYHSAELDVIRALGATAGPTDGFPPARDPSVDEYHELCVDQYIDAIPEGSPRPDRGYMIFDYGTSIGPLEPLRHLSDDARARFVEELLDSVSEWRPWILRHQTRREYPRRSFRPAAVWMVGEHGRVQTRRGVVSLARAWGPPFEEWEEIVPVVRIARTHAEYLEIPLGTDDLTDHHWQGAYEGLVAVTNDDLIGRFYGFACKAGAPQPGAVRCRVGQAHAERPPTDTALASDWDDFIALRGTGQPCLLVEDRDDASLLEDEWGLQPANKYVHRGLRWTEEPGRDLVVDAFPTLRDDLEAANALELELVPCSEIVETIATDSGAHERDVEFAVQERLVLWHLSIGFERALGKLGGYLGLDFSREELDDLVQQRWKRQRGDRLLEIRKLPTDSERLLEAVGEERLRNKLPQGLLQAVSEIHGPLNSIDVSRVALVVYGDEVLQEYRDALHAAGLDPPERWAGGYPARSFVRDLGFADVYAGAQSRRRESELEVYGPPDLPSLHDYQQAIVSEINRLLAADEYGRRGLMSLPTGAGKTRVAVQALVGAITAGRIASPVLWIAQSDELCEQAVQTWSEVWRAMGTTGELRIGRLWAANEVPEAVGTEQVVIATIDKLQGRVDTADYQWLAEASCIVIDEAHGATTPSYTRVLRWLGIAMSGATVKTRVPLLGLTATPFRGTSNEETHRLVRRFGGRRLDRVLPHSDDYEAMYRYLQDIGILSKVDARVLETGTVIDLERDLSHDELQSFNKGMRLPPRVSATIAQDVDRNRRLLSSILDLPSDWPVLLFAVSTDHAHVMAALLTMEGVSAAAIDYRTSASVRRRYIDRFRDGRLRVLTNYGVLAQGFDAPSVRAIYVARPAFSPNIYQQMIGRGLRGPKNGGKERCLIVNVRDNWRRYGEKLAFNEFERLWSPGSA